MRPNSETLFLQPNRESGLAHGYKETSMEMQNLSDLQDKLLI